MVICNRLKLFLHPQIPGEQTKVMSKTGTRKQMSDKLYGGFKTFFYLKTYMKTILEK